MMRWQALRSRWSEGGFSLLELVVALAIVSMVLVALVPLTGSWRRGVPTEAVVNDMVVVLREARAAAINRNRPTTFTLDGAAGRYWSDSLPVPRALPARVAIAVGSGQQSLGTIQFFPDGGASGGVITVQDTRRTYTIQIETLSGRVRLNVNS
jgi:general secretion pathway protein H